MSASSPTLVLAAGTFLTCWFGSVLTTTARASWSDGFAPFPGGSGLSDPAFDQVLALCGYRGELVAAGDFSDAGGVAVSRVALWDGEVWAAF